jgi:peptide/nickel transport system substrate-binding protein
LFRISLRSGVILVLALALGSGLLPSTPSIRAQDDNAIIIGLTDFPRTLDPADAIDRPSWELLYHVATGLTRQIPGTLDYELALAADHTVSPDGLVHTFAVRQDAAFNDGTPITAQTFVDSIERVIALGRSSTDFVNRYITSVEAMEDNAIQFTLNIPLPDFEAFVALPPFFPQHPAVFPADDVLLSENFGTFIGNGVYRIESFRPGREIVLVADPAYAGPPPASDRIILRHYTLPIDLRRAVEAHEVDVAWRSLALPDQAAVVETEGIILKTQPNLQTYYMLLNHQLVTANAGQASFDDPAVRQAFALLVDRERGASSGFEDTVTPLYSLLPEALGTSTVTFPGYDLTLAETVLQDAGYRERRRTVQLPFYISSQTYGDLMASAAQELRRRFDESRIVSITGIQDDLTETFTRVISRGEYMDAIIGWTPFYASPGGYLIPLAWSTSPIPANAGYGSPAIDALLREAALTDDPAVRDARYLEVQQSLLDHFDLIPLFQGQNTIAYWEDVSGVLVEANSWLHYDQIMK